MLTAPEPLSVAAETSRGGTVLIELERHGAWARVGQPCRGGDADPSELARGRRSAWAWPARSGSPAGTRSSVGPRTAAPVSSGGSVITHVRHPVAEAHVTLLEALADACLSEEQPDRRIGHARK